MVVLLYNNCPLVSDVYASRVTPAGIARVSIIHAAPTLARTEDFAGRSTTTIISVLVLKVSSGSSFLLHIWSYRATARAKRRITSHLNSYAAQM